MKIRSNNPARFNRRITIQRPDGYTRDDEAGTVPKWVDLITVWAAREPMSTRWREFFQAGATTSEMMVVYKIRWREGINPTMRVVARDRIYNIVAVLDDIDGSRRETHLLCREVIPGG